MSSSALELLSNLGEFRKREGQYIKNLKLALSKKPSGLLLINFTILLIEEISGGTIFKALDSRNDSKECLLWLFPYYRNNYTPLLNTIRESKNQKITLQVWRYNDVNVCNNERIEYVIVDTPKKIEIYNNNT